MKEIKGYEGLYLVSENGDVFSTTTNRKKKTEISNSGYARVNLFKNGKGKHFSVHRLVAKAFIANPNRLPCVNHKDGNKLNNNSCNLEWCDSSQNAKHAYRTGLISPKTTRVIQYTKDFKVIKEWESITEACEELGINHANIVTVCKRKTNRKLAGGFVWRYANDRI